jgi:uncharacterized Zn-binding protein involved in type VI secretion
VLIGHLSAARVTDQSACGGTILRGSPVVFIGGQMAARLGDQTAHGGVIVTGWPTVMIGDAPKGVG